ncbi:hypothetical protein [Streptomyces lydicus]|uniref:hypothetical protein n=1 Tax=Streptomyces lydicus TaxID=47763 RepID=UPI0036EE690C
MIYKLRNGYRVRAVRLASGATEFETKNQERETISTVVLEGSEADGLRNALFVEDAIRFGEVFGSGRAG